MTNEKQINEIQVHKDNEVMSFMQNIISNNVDVGVAEKMMDVFERFMLTKQKEAFNHDFVKMQQELPVIKQKRIAKMELKNGGKMSYNFANITDINQQIKPFLEKYNFAVSFEVNQSNGILNATAILMHQQGHSISSSVSVPYDNSGAKNAVQAIGSASQYARRYALCQLLNISQSDDDDDGHSAAFKGLNDYQAQTIHKLLNDASEAVRTTFINQYGGIQQVSAGQFNIVVARLKNAIANESKKVNDATN